MGKTELVEQGKQNAALVVNNSFIDGLSAQLKEKQQYGLTFPADYNPTNALTGAYLIMKETVDKNGKSILESCSQTSIANSLMDMVTLGLNANKKQGYFIAYAGKCQFQKSYFGNITLAQRNGLKNISAEIIYEGDSFKYHIEDGMKVIDEHEQDFMNVDVDKIKGAYAVAIMEDGRKIVEIMNICQLRKAWNQRMGGLKDDASSTHKKFADQMAKKTVINRLCKVIANTSTDGNIAEISDRLDRGKMDVDVVAEDAQHDISENANSVPFEDMEVVDAEVVDAEIVENKSDMPDFMQE